MKWYSLALLILLAPAPGMIAHAQDKNGIKFGKPRPEDFDLQGVSFDSGANAIVIADIGSTVYQADVHGLFNMIYTRTMRIKILNKNGFDAAVFGIYLHRGSTTEEEKLKDVKGITYNKEGGVISETKLESAAVYTDKETKHHLSKKFTMPGLKEGSVFDLTYTIVSPQDLLMFLRSWEFQKSFPCMWSEYTVTIPPALHYVTQVVGNAHFDVNESKDVYQTFAIRESRGAEADDVTNVSGNSVQHRWGIKNVPAIHEEDFLSATGNYVPAVRFQLHYFQWNDQNQRIDIMGNWFMASKKLMADENFGTALKSDNHWMNAEMKALVGDGATGEQKMRRIYDYIRSGFSCTSYEGIYAASSLKEVFRKKSGSVAEINLLLTALLRHEGIVADPVLLSTRDNGVAEQSYPLMSQFNYVICNAILGGKSYHLDASRPMMGFGKLVTNCYNGQGRMINEQSPYLVNLFPDSVTEAKLTSVLISIDEKDKNTLNGSCMKQLGDAGSYDLRQEIKKTSQKDYFKTVKTTLNDQAELTSTTIDSLDKYDFPATVRYEFKMRNEPDLDVIYFNPIVAGRYASNPFKAAKRQYPVEIPYCIDETYLLTMDIPEGYVAEEIPKSAKLSLNENEGYFEYLIQKSATQIQMRVRLKLKKADFETDDYNPLREFYTYIVKKENEQIVFRKAVK